MMISTTTMKIGIQTKKHILIILLTSVIHRKRLAGAFLTGWTVLTCFVLPDWFIKGARLKKLGIVSK